MFLKHKKSGGSRVLFCFSPPVMIATFVIEIGMAAYLLGRYALSPTLRISVAILCMLALFQLSEFGLCEDLLLSSDVWAKIGFGAITLLPPLGLHLVLTLGRIRSWKWLAVLYGSGLVWTLIFVFGGVMLSQACSGNYVLFEIKRPYDVLYYSWYNALLIAAIIKAWLLLRFEHNKKLIRAYWALIIGYLSFIVPSIIVRFLFEFDDTKASALPSIMCGFAVVFAAILTFRMSPLVAQKKRRR